MDFYIQGGEKAIMLCNMVRFIGDAQMAAAARRSPTSYWDGVDSDGIRKGECNFLLFPGYGAV